MDYPPLIYLGQDEKTKLIQYLDQELLTHYAERSQFVQDRIEEQQGYNAEPSGVRTFPFQGAANVVIPLIAIASEAYHAREMQTLFGLDNQFVTCKLPDQFSAITHSLEKYMDWETLKGMEFRKYLEDPLLEKTIHGTGIAKVEWNKHVKRVNTNGASRELVTKQGNELKCVPLANFLMPFTSQDPQTAPWCGEEHTSTKADIDDLINSGVFYPGMAQDEAMLSWVRTVSDTALSSAPFRSTVEKEQSMTPAWPKWIGWVEICLSWDVDGSKKPKEIVVYYHRMSRTILGLRYNWFEDLRRPYRIANHFKWANRWMGIGQAKMNKQFQLEITTQHRQRLDNATIANTRFWKVNRLANISQGDPIFPNKMFFVDNKDDIEPMQAGDVYASAYNNEQQTLLYAQQRSSVNELNQGMQQVGTPGTAASDLARLQESSRKFDYSIRNSKTFVSELLNDSVCNIAQFGHRNIRYFDFNADGQLLQSFFKLPVSLLREGIILQINPVGSQQNKLVDRNNWQQISQGMQLYFTQMIQLAQVVNPQLVPVIATRAMMGGTEAFKQLLESFDVRNINRITIQDVLNGLLSQVNGGAAIGSPQTVDPTGMVVPPSINGGSVPTNSPPIGAV